MMAKYWIIILIISVFPQASRAEEILQPTALPTAQSQEVSKKKTLKGKRTSEKEAEGTQAPNRFEANTVIKSKYQVNGEPLEVDPD